MMQTQRPLGAAELMWQQRRRFQQASTAPAWRAEHDQPGRGLVVKSVRDTDTCVRGTGSVLGQVHASVTRQRSSITAS